MNYFSNKSKNEEVYFRGQWLGRVYGLGLYDKNKFVKIYDLLKDISRNSYTGKGKPEALKHELKGYWSRRIDDKHGLIYRINPAGDIEIIACKGHHSDK